LSKSGSASIQASNSPQNGRKKMWKLSAHIQHLIFKTFVKIFIL
jgi:hypothetical protein